MRTVATKVDNSLHEALIRTCNDRGCSPSEYLRELLRQDAARRTPDARQDRVVEHNGKPVSIGRVRHGGPASSNRPTYYLHKSNPNIVLIDKVVENGETYYIDTRGKKWQMAPDGTLIGIVNW